MSPLKFWFEYSSPYSALSAYELLVLHQRGLLKKHTIQPQVFLLGALLKKHDLPIVPFANHKLKFDYMWTDVARQLKVIKNKYELDDNFEIKQPPTFPVNSLLAARVTTLLQTKMESETLLKFVVCLYNCSFNKFEDIGKQELLQQQIQFHFPDYDAEQILNEATSQSNKDKLKDNVEEAFRLGLFGAPTFTGNNRLFWGSDRLLYALEAMGNKL